MVRQTVSHFWPTLTFTAALWKESMIWLCAIALLIIIQRGERLPLRSVGLGRTRWWKSILWGLVIALVCGALGTAIALLTQYGHGPGSRPFAKLPLWLIILIVVRAGAVEEFFYRGYAIERLETLGLGRLWSTGIPLAIFSLAHWTGGWANIVIALALGGVLTGFYLWHRDLTANIIGHFSVDFVANVLPASLEFDMF
jgi:uncharacterized protein